MSLPPMRSACRSLRSTFLILSAGSAGMAVLLAYLPAAGHDQLWLLYVARHILFGEHLYGPTLLESNPPLIVWLSLVPAWLSLVPAWLSLVPAWLGAARNISDAALGKGLVVLLQLLVGAAAWRSVRRLLPSIGGTQASALLCSFVVMFNVVPARDLGQRDYLLALLCLPYLLLAARRSQQLPVSAAEACFTGITAAVGIALKPHEVLLPVAVEVWLLWRRRSFHTLLRPEPLAIAGGGCVYLAAMYAITPRYFTVVLPLLRDTYWAVGSLGLMHLLWEAIELHLLAAAALFFRWRWRRDPAPENRIADVFLVAGAASLLAYYLQGTGWYYQQLPSLCFFAGALTLMLLPLTRRVAPRWLPGAAGALSVLALALTTHFMDYPFTTDRSYAISSPNPAFFRGLAPGTPVATLTTTVDDTVMPAARYHLTIAQRYPHLWLLPAILRNEQPDPEHPARHTIPEPRLRALDALQHRFMVEDLRRWQPPLVLVERCQDAAVHCQLLEDRHDDLLAWFRRDPAFAELWRGYRFAGSRGEFDAWVRRGTDAAP